MELKNLASSFRIPVAAAVIFLLVGCGTILHPERRGQQGRLDVGVVVLDAVGLLFFIIPGVIAFAVDFSNGTIYLPGGGLSRLAEGPDPQERVRRFIEERTGREVRLDAPGVEIFGLTSPSELPAYFAAVRTGREASSAAR